MHAVLWAYTKKEYSVLKHVASVPIRAAQVPSKLQYDNNWSIHTDCWLEYQTTAIINDMQSTNTKGMQKLQTSRNSFQSHNLFECFLLRFTID